MLIFNANSLHKIFVRVLILYWILKFLVFRAYLKEPPPWDYITKRKTQKNIKIQMRYKMVVLILGYGLNHCTMQFRVLNNFLNLYFLYLICSLYHKNQGNSLNRTLGWILGNHLHGHGLNQINNGDNLLIKSC